MSDEYEDDKEAEAWEEYRDEYYRDLMTEFIAYKDLTLEFEEFVKDNFKDYTDLIDTQNSLR